MATGRARIAAPTISKVVRDLARPATAQRPSGPRAIPALRGALFASIAANTGIAGSRKTADGVTDQNFAGGSHAANSCGNVDRGTNEAFIRLGCLAGVNSDCDLDGLVGMLPGFGRRSIDDGQATAHCRRGRWEHHIETVAFGFDLSAAKPGHSTPDEATVSVKQPACGTIAVGLGKRGVVAEITEEEAMGRAGARRSCLLWDGSGRHIS
jgi:hypothetical protein